MDRELLERDRELETLSARLAHTAAGVGACVVLEAPAGAGKSALMWAAREAARDAGARVCVAVGGELERDFPFGLVRQLLEPVVRGAPAQERDRLLAGAAAAAAPTLGIGEAGETGGDSSFATLHGLYWLVAGLAEQSTVVLLVDDAHWGDEPSLRFLEFLSRRVSEIPVLLVAATRPAEPGAAQELLTAIIEVAGDDVLRPAPLSAEGVRTFVAAGLGDEAAEAVVTGAAETTGGNPLLLRELVRTLSTADSVPTAESVREAVPSSVVRSVARRLGRLSPSARLAAEGLALAGQAPAAPLLCAMTGLDASTVLEGLAALRAVELVEGDPPRYVHPLVRAAVAEATAPAQRTALHHGAIDHLRGSERELDELLVHLMAVPLVGEGWVIDSLRTGARRAAADGAPETALRRLRRAVEESQLLGLDPSGVQLELGAAELGAGEPTAIEHLEAAAASDDDEVAAEALRILLGSGHYIRAPELSRLVDRGEAVVARLEAAGEPAGRLVAQTYAALIQVPALTARRQEKLAVVGSRPSPDVISLQAFEDACGDAGRATVAARAALVARDAYATLQQVEQPLAMYAQEGALQVDAWEGWEAAHDRAEAIARRSGSRLAAAFVAFTTANWAIAVGSVASAEARAEAAYAYFADYASTIPVAIAGTLATARLRRGRVEEADRALADPGTDEELSELYSGLFVFNRRAEVRFAQRRYGEAVADLRRLDDLVRRFGWRRFSQGYGRQLLAIALVRDGQREEGLALARSELAEARQRRVPGAEAAALIALGHAATGSESMDAFEAAVDAADGGATLWVRANAAYEWGAALRRGGQRTDARRHLVAGRDLAERIDAAALVQQATEELLVAGGRPRRTRSSGLDGLTPSERRVAEHAAAGMSNREIAETLFVTRKTVELHLGNTFGKLGIRSRTQLAGILAGEAAAA